MNPKILLVEDDTDLREALIDTLELNDFDAIGVSDGMAAIAALKEAAVDLVVSDVNMPNMDGHQLLAWLRLNKPELPVVLMTAYGNVTQAVEAMQNGAADYLAKPFEANKLLTIVQRFAGGKLTSDAPVAASPASQKVLEMAAKVAQTDVTLMINGESGTGKEVLAQYVHQQSNRANGPFVAINCAAIPENMLEATLFGHEKGAFTGAIASQPGKFELANGGTLLLDEVTEMDINLQAKLLRVLQEREVERVGGRKPIALDVRVIATSNRDLLEAVRSGQFREDLYYRLNVVELSWLPLRERPEDILPLADRLLQKHASKLGKPAVKLTESARVALQQYQWPGNIREMDNIIQRALIFQQGQTIEAHDLHLPNAKPVAIVESDTVTEDEGPELSNGVKRHEFDLIVNAIRQCRGKKKDAADMLGISPRTLRYKLAKLREMGLDVDATVAA
ncbi:sigma-54-dependent transcriptional regulator [Salinibius halmophilus]|uniref:sigma-54-dependent transcriptional regulator n=1 Tax=Salinibius halmophilus TaxID=1853216 RepID=UPI000E6668A7|nr:sigma-54 dependent transcriptional regulator [Salinibius halmophilus]